MLAGMTISILQGKEPSFCISQKQFISPLVANLCAEISLDSTGLRELAGFGKLQDD